MNFKLTKGKLFFLLTLSQIFSLVSLASIPFPKRELLVPVCAVNMAAQRVIEGDLMAMNNPTEEELADYMKGQLLAGNLMSNTKLLLEMKTKYEAGKDNTPEGVLQITQERMNYLQTLEDNNGTGYIYDKYVFDTTDLSFPEEEDLKFQFFQKICNGGDPNAEHPFSIHRFEEQGG
jgi:hypothetical protein